MGAGAGRTVISGRGEARKPRARTRRAAGTKAALFDVNHPGTGGRRHLHPAPCTRGPRRPPPSAWSTQTQGCNRPGFGETSKTYLLPINASRGTPKLAGDGHGLPPTCGGAFSGTGPVWAPAHTLSGPQPPSEVELRASLGWASRAPEEQGSHPPCHGAWPSGDPGTWGPGYLGIWGGKSFGGGLQKDPPREKKAWGSGQSSTDHLPDGQLAPDWPQIRFFGLCVGVLSVLPDDIFLFVFLSF